MFVEVAQVCGSRSRLVVCISLQPYIAITKQKIIDKCYFRLRKETSVHKDWIFYTKSSILDVPLCSGYASEPFTIFAIGSILMFEWVLDTLLTCLKKDKNCEKPVKELFLETLQQRLRNNLWEISEKNSTERWFSSQLFSASFVRNPEAAIRDVL